MSGIDLVTGGAGFIGSHLVERLLAEGRRVRVLDDLSRGRWENLPAGSSHMEIVLGSVTDPAGNWPMEGVERVFHLAALADVVPSVEDPVAYYHVNVSGTLNACLAATEARVKRFVYAASSSCYGANPMLPATENDPIDPAHPYALTKRLGEEIALHWKKVYGLPTVSARLFNVYGPRSRTSGAYGAVIGVWLAQIANGHPLTIVGTGTQRRDFLHVKDACEALITLADKAASFDTYNIGSGVGSSIMHLKFLIERVYDEKLPVIGVAERRGEPHAIIADIGRLKNAFGWRPTISLEAGVEDMLSRLDDWKDAPVWTPEKIARATETWHGLMERA